MDRPAPRFLVIEDNPGDFVLVEEFLSEQFDAPRISRAANFRQAIGTLESAACSFDAILLDLTLPDQAGEPLISAIVTACAGSPVIVLTGYTDFAFGVRSLSLGVADYLLKDELTALAIYKSIVYSWQRQGYIAQLAASEKNYSDLFRLSPQPMWVFDQQTLRFLEVNQAATEHYGYTDQEFRAMSILDIRPPEEQQGLRQLLSELRQDREMVKQGLFIHQKKNGELIHVEIQSNSIVSHGRAARLVLANDVTERFKYVKAIEDQNEKLRQISWMQSHIIRAPLARIMGLLPLIGQARQQLSGPAEELDEMLSYLDLSARELDEVIHDITEKIKPD